MLKKRIELTNYSHYKLERTYSEVVKSFTIKPTIPVDSITRLVKVDPDLIWTFNLWDDLVEVQDLTHTFTPKKVQPKRARFLRTLQAKK